MLNTPEAKKLSAIRRYFTEIAVLALAACVSVLFYLQRDLEKEFRGTLQVNQAELIKQLERNTEALDRDQETHQRILTFLNDKQH